MPHSLAVMAVCSATELNPRYGRLDPYAMAACVIAEAVRNCVAVGADPDRIALRNQFRSMVQAAIID